MLLVEIRIPDKDVVPEHITTMRLWLNHHRLARHVPVQENRRRNGVSS